MKWEYLIDENEDYERSYIEKELNKYGQDGWELVHVSQSLRTYFFKRPMQEQIKDAEYQKYLNEYEAP